MLKKIIFQNKTLGYRTNGTENTMPIVLVHGFCEDSLLWNPIMPFLKKHRVIRIDLPGFGVSEAADAVTIEAYAEAVLAVLQKEKIKKCILLGHSMGGYTTLAFAKKYADFLGGFGLIHSHPFADDDERKEARARSAALLENGKQNAYLDLLFPAFFGGDFIKKNPAILGTLRRRAKKYPTQGIINALFAMRDRAEHTQVLKNSKVPVLMFLGAKDTLLPPYTENEMLKMPAIAAIHILPDIAHMGMFESPNILGHAMDDFHIFVVQQS